jgi:uncharacterized membrane protein YGL010W
MRRSGIRMQCYWKKSCITSTIGEASTAAWITKGVLETGIAWTIKSLGHGKIFYHQEQMLLVDDKRISARRETSFEGEGTEHT